MAVGRELLGGTVKIGREVLGCQRHGGAQQQAGCAGKVRQGKQRQAAKETCGPVGGSDGGRNCILRSCLQVRYMVLKS